MLDIKIEATPFRKTQSLKSFKNVQIRTTKQQPIFDEEKFGKQDQLQKQQFVDWKKLGNRQLHKNLFSKKKSEYSHNHI